jgi:flagellar hook protein FlgE
VETAINTDATISAAGKSVTVGVSNGKLVITSDSTGPTSTVTVSGGNGATNLLGTAPVRVAGAAPFNMANPATYNSSTSATIYDTLGNPHVMTMYFVKAAAVGAGAPATASSQWDMYVSVEGTATSFVTAGGAAMPYSLYYDTSGKNLAPATPPTFSVDLTGLMAALIPPQTNTAASPMTFTVDQSATTQFGSAFGVNNMVQDGFTSGRLAGISISADGIIQGRYSNGQSKKMGQIVLAKFNNPNGLQSLGGNQWQETSASGASIIGAPGTGSNGVVQSAAVEESNTDLTAELVQMITQQRAYQANAQTIKTQDSVMQTLVNLR